MSQTTFTGEIIESRVPLTQIQGVKRIIYNHLLFVGRGLTLKEIQKNLAYTKITTFDNRLRELRSMGWVKTWKPTAQSDQYYYAVRPSDVKPNE